jgi:hypothetical protein
MALINKFVDIASSVPRDTRVSTETEWHDYDTEFMRTVMKKMNGSEEIRNKGSTVDEIGYSVEEIPSTPCILNIGIYPPEDHLENFETCAYIEDDFIYFMSKEVGKEPQFFTMSLPDFDKLLTKIPKSYLELNQNRFTYRRNLRDTTELKQFGYFITDDFNDIEKVYCSICYIEW